MRIWFKIYENARILKSETIEDLTEETRTHKVFQALEKACHIFDLGNPIWLDANINEFKRTGKTRFYPDNFIEEISFDFMEMQILEED